MSLTYISCYHVRTFSGGITRKLRDRVRVKTSGGKRRIEMGRERAGRKRARLGCLTEFVKLTSACSPRSRFLHFSTPASLLTYCRHDPQHFIWRQLFLRDTRRTSATRSDLFTRSTPPSFFTWTK